MSRALSFILLVLLCQGQVSDSSDTCLSEQCKNGDNDEALEDQALLHVSIRKHTGIEPEHVMCPVSRTKCTGNQCCPGIDETDNKTFPCPSADEGWNQCESNLAVVEGDVTVFWWNSHYQCSEGIMGATPKCSLAAKNFLVEQVNAHGAHIAAGIETFPSTDPKHIPYNFSDSLPGWTQVNGICTGKYPDQVGLMFAPGWTVLGHGGSCLFRSNSDTRAFVAAKVRPPTPFHGCAELCVVAVHLPHAIVPMPGAKDEVDTACGSTAENCTIAFGDWNQPAQAVEPQWANFLPGKPSALPQPDVGTCCLTTPGGTYGDELPFDHLATNLASAPQLITQVLPYPIRSEVPTETHKPVIVTMKG